MASALDTVNCNTSGNTGLIKCSFAPDIFVRPIAVPKGTVIPASSMTDAATFNDYLASQTIADNRNNRYFILPPMTNLKDNTGDVITEKRNNQTFFVANPGYSWEYQMTSNYCLYLAVKNLLTYGIDVFDYLFLDAMGNVIGTAATDANGDTGLAGWSMSSIFIADWTQKTASNLPKYMIMFTLENNKQAVENSAWMTTNFTPNMSTMGLQNVALYKGGTTTATHLFVGGKLGCGATELGDTWGSTLADDAYWTVTNPATGASITVSAVSYNATTKLYDLTIASTPATKLTVALAAPSVLTADGMYIVTETADKVNITTP